MMHASGSLATALSIDSSNELLSKQGDLSSTNREVSSKSAGEVYSQDHGEQTRIDWSKFCYLMLPFWLLQLVLVCLSNGAYHDDDVSHYIISRRAWSQPVLFLNVWGRPGFTIPYALTAIIGSPLTGWLACRLLSVAICTLTAILTTKVAARLNFRYPEWCGPLFMLIPLNFQLSITTLTETICGLYFILATWLFIEKRWYLAAIVLGLTMLSRHEAIVTVAAGSLILISLRQFGPALMVWLPELVWNAACYRFQSYDMPINRYLSGNANHSYGSGGLVHGFWMWAEAAGTPAIVLIVVGGVLLLIRSMSETSFQSAWIQSSDAPKSRSLIKIFWRAISEKNTIFLGLWLVVVGAWGTVLLNTALYSLNFFASGGYGRFLVPAAPWMVLCIHAALAELAESMKSETVVATSHSGGLVRNVNHTLRLVVSPLGLAVLMWLAVISSIILMSLQTDRWFLNYLVSYILSPAVTIVAACLFVMMFCVRNKNSQFSGLLAKSACLVGSLAWAMAFVGASQPLRLTPTQALYADAVHWIEQRESDDNVYVTANSPLGEVFAAEAGFHDISIYTLPWLKQPFYLLVDTQCMMERERKDLLERYKAHKVHEVVTTERISQTTGESSHAVEIYYAGIQESQLASYAAP
ncbi:hypothetical protein Plim_1479 [Planctopirus limnophila DSM 3776]|uniref:Glycosyltransferase RgtA/B/C/D-like domain-containing protein n=1 Tax=Planctopirus limnophila (strain ATCC 43296 / DSM 3776 / IFAM 1008 / Mu 290) TaxID=521674 RepID=D5SW27_PLAL2|nr:hypothetical protein [Planctopirus limnophila]ADG67312.1 hypothetical protein Plim_1479 [Planctopirus limnophila DSM 3776]